MTTHQISDDISVHLVYYEISFRVIKRALTPAVNRPGIEADHSPPLGADVKNAWSYTPTPTTPLWSGAKLNTGKVLLSLCSLFFAFP
jgi:hypothetical protein